MLILFLQGFNAFANTPLNPFGSPLIPVIPMEFQDVAFSVEEPQAVFESHFQKVSLYFSDNSLGRFTPSFHVQEPVKLTKNLSYYGANNAKGFDRAIETAMKEALEESNMDFEALADLVIFVFAGYDEAEGGILDALWSRQGYFEEEKGLIGKNYVCVGELSGNSGSVLCGIGKACHEVGHAMGLPDFYDTDGAENSIAGGMYGFSLMGIGLYNGGGNVPPYMSAVERNMLGWMEEIPVLPQTGGTVQLGSIADNAAYMIPTAMDGEFFVLERRNGEKWDSTLPKGLILYHIDRSSRQVKGWTYTPGELWSTMLEDNLINAYGEHPCASLVPAIMPSSLSFTGSVESMVYPGAAQVVYADPLDWDGNQTAVKLADITPESVYVITNPGEGILGRVFSEGETPVEGATVSCDLCEEPVLTGPDGRFFLPLTHGSRDLPYSLSVRCDGFRNFSLDAVMQGKSAYHTIELTGQGMAVKSDLSKYDATADPIFYPFPDRNFGDCLAAVRFSPSELFLHAGKRIESISFSLYFPSGAAEEVYVIVDFGAERVLTRKVENPVFGLLANNTVDISDADLRIPDGTPVYIGYGIKGSEYVYPLGATITGHEGNSFYSKWDGEKSDWIPMYSTRSRTGFMDLILSAGLSEVISAPGLREMGYSSIELPSKLTPGQNVYLRIQVGAVEPLSVKWYMDSAELPGSNLVIPSGEHVIEASLEYSSGRSETIRKYINVN